jgi:hypothetical protein
MSKVVKVGAFTSTTHDDGSVSLDSPNTTVEMDDDGTAKVTLKGSLTKVGIENIFDLVGYSITSDSTATTHHLQFIDGGEARISYRADGKLLEFGCKRVEASITQEGEVSLKKYAKNEGES